MGQDILCVLETLGHLGVVAVQCLVERHRRPLSLLVDVGHVPVLGVEENLCMILEVNLYNFVAQSEHDGVLRPHPLLHVDGAWRVLQFICLVHFISLDQLLFFLRIVILLQI